MWPNVSCWGSVPDDVWVCSTSAMKRIKSSPLVQMRRLLTPRVTYVSNMQKESFIFFGELHAKKRMSCRCYCRANTHRKHRTVVRCSTGVCVGASGGAYPHQ